MDSGSGNDSKKEMILTSEDFHNHDFCPRFRQYDSRYARLRISLPRALSETLDYAIAKSDPSLARPYLMSLATNPGLDLTARNLYRIVIHHASLLELLATYILAVSTVTQPEPISMPWGEYRSCPILRDGRLRRILLVDRWTVDAEARESWSWRTAAETAITGRAMLLNIFLIGRANDSGIRISPWTMGYKHPVNGVLRIKRHNDEYDQKREFKDTWEKVYRENTDHKPMHWLGMMQSDDAFKGWIQSTTIDTPPNRAEILDQIAERAREIHSSHTRQNLASCFKLRPCAFNPACLTDQSPSAMGWKEKEIDVPLASMLSCP